MSNYPRGIAVIGLGYIGLPTAAALATQGVRVHGVDVDERTVASVNRGEVPFVEPDLGVAVSGAVALGLLTATIDVPEADAYIVAVPTPFLDDKSGDLSFVRAAVEALAPRLTGGAVVVLESTSPPGATETMSHWLSELRPDLSFPHQGAQGIDVHIAHCPERVLPGRIMIEMVTNDRVVGGLTPACGERAAAIYRTFSHGHIAVTDAGSAEMSKLAENAFRDVNLAFANELSLICDDLDLDVWEVIRNANRHPRVNILTPGPGVGGHCIAVDPWFIVAAAPQRARLIRTAREVNDERPAYVARMITERADRLKSPVLACLGLSFKADVDDLRESPAVQIVQTIASALPQATLLVAEPHISSLPGPLQTLSNVHLTETDEAIERSDLVALLVDHRAFRSVRKTAMQGRAVFDTRGFWS